MCCPLLAVPKISRWHKAACGPDFRGCRCMRSRSNAGQDAPYEPLTNDVNFTPVTATGDPLAPQQGIKHSATPLDAGRYHKLFKRPSSVETLSTKWPITSRCALAALGAILLSECVPSLSSGDSFYFDQRLCFVNMVWGRKVQSRPRRSKMQAKFKLYLYYGRLEASLSAYREWQLPKLCTPVKELQPTATKGHSLR